MLAYFSRKIRQIPNLDLFVGDELIFRPRRPDDCRAVLFWGKQPCADAQKFADKYNLPSWRLEEGFLRSVGLGAFYKMPPMSIIHDRSGIYYDATRPSDLETLLNSTGWETPQLLDKAAQAIQAIIRKDISKTNQAVPAPPGLLAEGGKKIILLIDQTFNDLSVSLGMAGPDNFAAMLEAAKREHPDARIYIKTHPNVLAGIGKGYFTGMDLTGVSLLGGNHTPLSLLAQADEVYAVSSQMGFEALLLGKRVSCFGLPFYAGWGLTRDHVPCARRRIKRSLTEVFAAAYILYQRFINPVTRLEMDIMETISLLAEQKKINDFNRGELVCLAGQRHKKTWFNAYLHSTHNRVLFAGKPAVAEKLARANKARLVVWNGAQPQSGVLNILRADRGLLPMAGFTSRIPVSLVFDPVGIYNDHTAPSGLEQILSEYDFRADQELLRRAANIRAMLAKIGDAAGSNRSLGNAAVGAKKILVIGQSKTATAGIGAQADLKLLQTVRGLNPGAFLIYQSAQVRQTAAEKEKLASLADAAPDVDNAAQLFAGVDAVHVFDDLAGFAALLRGLAVHTHGGPFYAGWGLTTDELPFPRRSRRLSLDELVAGSLILYPTYYDEISGQFCNAEDIIFRLLNPGAPRFEPPLDPYWEIYKCVRLLRAKIKFGKLAKDLSRLTRS